MIGPARADPCAPVRGRAGGTSPRVAPVPVLLIAPDPGVRDNLRVMLESRGLQVCAPGSINEASERLASGSILPRLLLVDGHAHGEFDGVDAARWLAARSGPALPTVLMTGDLSSNLRRRARAAGVMLLHKPVTVDRLVGAIGDVIAIPA